MNSVENRFHAELKRRIGERRAKLQAALGEGTAGDHSMYRGICGQLTGLRDALELADQVEADLSGRTDAGREAR